ncbi:MAG: DUF378 domain-containing protein [Bauldia sp.]|jgi:uncharacterized membrane protein YuzA (DUF378 family)
MPLRILNLITLSVVILGGINWGLVGAFQFDVISLLFGRGAGRTNNPTLTAQAFYVLIGLCAAWQLIVLFRRLLVPRPRP